MRFFAVFALLMSMFFVSDVDAQSRRGRGPVRRVVAGRRAPVRQVRRVQFRRPVVVRAPFVVRRNFIAVRSHAVIAPVVAIRRQAIVVPTYAAYVAPSQLVVQRIVTAPYTAPVVVEKEEAPVEGQVVQKIVVQRVTSGYSGFSGGCGATAAFRSY